MIYIDDNNIGYLLNESLLAFMHCRYRGASDRPAADDILLHARYLHNSTRFKLMAQSTDYADISRNVNEHNIEEPIALNRALRKVLDHPNGYLFLCNTWEYFPIFSRTFQAGMWNLMQYLGIPRDRVIVSCCDALNPPILDPLPIKGFGFDWAFLREKLNSEGLVPVTADQHRRKHFVFLNRRFTEDRFLLYLFIHAGRYQEKFHLSFLSRPSDKALPSILDRVPRLPSMAKYRNTIEGVLTDCLARIPIELDGSLETIEWAGTATVRPYLEDAFIFLVNETLPESDGCLFLSEKTYKPIRLGMPFIVFGAKGTLNHLRHMGFKSFHPHIDERYDEEEDPARRLDLIMQEIERLCRMDKVAIRRLHQRMAPIAAHNFRQLKKKEKIPALEAAFRHCLDREPTNHLRFGG
jgi:hypothetical protein